MCFGMYALIRLQFNQKTGLGFNIINYQLLWFCNFTNYKLNSISMIFKIDIKIILTIIDLYRILI